MGPLTPIFFEALTLNCAKECSRGAACFPVPKNNFNVSPFKGTSTFSRNRTMKFRSPWMPANSDLRRLQGIMEISATDCRTRRQFVSILFAIPIAKVEISSATIMLSNHGNSSLAGAMYRRSKQFLFFKDFDRKMSISHSRRACATEESEQLNQRFDLCCCAAFCWFLQAPC